MLLVSKWCKSLYFSASKFFLVISYLRKNILILSPQFLQMSIISPSLFKFSSVKHVWYFLSSLLCWNAEKNNTLPHIFWWVKVSREEDAFVLKSGRDMFHLKLLLNSSLMNIWLCLWTWLLFVVVIYSNFWYKNEHMDTRSR